MLFDTHAHFYAAGGVESDLAVLERAASAGVDLVTAVGGSPELNAGALRLARSASGALPITLGLDRSQAEQVAGSLTSAIDVLSREIAGARADGLSVVGIGEMGLDYYYEADARDAQSALFSTQLALASRLALPVVVHSREAESDTLKALSTSSRAAKATEKRLGVLHCFTGGYEFAMQLIEMGMLISFSGILTFKNANALREVAARLPLDSLLIETDSPYLAPVPVRGQQNEPMNAKYVCRCLSEVCGISYEELARKTHQNACRLFAL